MKVRQKIINLNIHEIRGVEIALPNLPLVIAIGKTAYIMCGYLNIDVAEKAGDTAAMVRGVKNVDELLSGTVVAMTSAARAKGVSEGVTGRDALMKMLT
jgi:uncharacterized protein YunC (DUF1805 family)